MTRQFFILHRTPGVDWPHGMTHVHPDAADALVAALKESGFVPETDTPTPGWARRYPRDQRIWPCREHTQGAYPAWIWTSQ